jgi:hypothetical protein
MSTPATEPDDAVVNEPSAPGLNPQAEPASRRRVPRAYVVLAAVGWLAAGFSFWLQSIGRELPSQPPAVRVEDREKAGIELNATQQKLASAESALVATTRLRDEAAQGLQEVRERTASAKKELAAARGEFDDLRRKIGARSSELAALTKRLDTVRSQDFQVANQADANSTATSAVRPAPAPPKTNPADAAPPLAVTHPVSKATPDPTPQSDGKSRQLSDSDRSIPVIGPGAASRPSDFELHSGRISRTP